MARTFDLFTLALGLGAWGPVLLVLYWERLRERRSAPRHDAAVDTKLEAGPGTIGPAPESRVQRCLPRGDAEDCASDLARFATADTLSSSFRMPIGEPPLVSELADDPDIADIVVDFVNVLGSRADALRTAFTRQDTDSLKRIVHQLKGAAGGYGFPSISEQARQVELALGNSDDREQVKQAVDGLCTLCFRACLSAPPVRVSRSTTQRSA